jgi:GNAT superfamily N-acetyltransferase
MDRELYYIHKPAAAGPPHPGIDFLPVREFLADEPACKTFWDLIDTQFRTRSKFLSIWPCVSFVAVARTPDGDPAGFLLVSAPVNWQIDYVVVHPSARGQGVGTQLVKAALSQAYLHRAPYVMLTSKESLRPLYEGCGFRVVSTPGEVVV